MPEHKVFWLPLVCLGLFIFQATSQGSVPVYCASAADCENQPVATTCDSGVCVQCSTVTPGCILCQSGDDINSATCLQCNSAGYISYPINGTCIACTGISCEIGIAGSCQDPNCIQCNNTQYCDACALGYYQLSGQCLNCTTLDFDKNVGCARCSPYQEYGIFACDLPFPGYFIGGNSGVYACNDTVYGRPGCTNCTYCQASGVFQCQLCGDQVCPTSSNPNCLSCTTEFDCVQCTAGYMLIDNSCVSCTAVLPNQQPGCAVCSFNFTTQVFTCDQALPGYVLLSNQTFYPCNSTQFGLPNCTECYFDAATDNVNCTSCGNINCSFYTECEIPNCQICPNTINCSLCAIGYVNNTYQGNYSQCLDSTYATANPQNCLQCLPCNAVLNISVTDSSIECELNVQTNQLQCVAFLAQELEDINQNTYECYSLPSYNAAAALTPFNQYLCAQCPLYTGSFISSTCPFGFLSSSNNLTAQGYCSDCSKFDPICIQCDTDGEIEFAGFCTSCPNGISCLSVNNTCVLAQAFDTNAQYVYGFCINATITCIPGYFKPLPNINSCVPCSSLSAEAVVCSNSTGTPIITQCSSGYYITANQSSCLSCGIYNADTCYLYNNTIVIGQCLPGFYYNYLYGSCVTCGAVGVSRCIIIGCTLLPLACFDGYFLNMTERTCDPCTGSNKTGGVPNCLTCTAPSATSGNYTPQCLTCAVGFLYDPVYNLCVDCSISNCLQCGYCQQPCLLSQTLLCIVCAPQYILKDNQCILCDTENCQTCFQNVQNTTSVCMACVSGYYLDCYHQCISCFTIASNCSTCAISNSQAYCTGYNLYNSTWPFGFNVGGSIIQFSLFAFASVFVALLVVW